MSKVLDRFFFIFILIFLAMLFWGQEHKKKAFFSDFDTITNPE